MIREDFLELLKCPLNHGPLANADAGLLDQVNLAIAEKSVKNRGGEVVEEPLDGGLVDETSTLIYPVREGIPCLLIDEAISLETIVEGSE